MRLINAHKMLIKLPAELPARQRLRTLDSIRESIEQMPTVEAIPIEWLKKQAEDTTYQHRVDGLIERWRKQHD